jgi:enoyl-CoA hydratase
MLCGDARVASSAPDIMLGLTEAKAGVPFPAGPLELITSELSPELLRKLTLTSATLAPADLHRVGVIDELVSGEGLTAAAESQLRALAAQPGFIRVKEQIRRATRLRLEAIADSGEDPLIATLDADQP